MRPEWVERTIPKIYRNFPAPSQAVMSEIRRFIGFVGWRLVENNSEDGHCSGFICDKSASLSFETERESFWISRRLLDSIRENESRWLAINRYFSSDEVEKREILSWAKSQGAGGWDGRYWDLVCNGIQIPSLSSVFRYKREEILFPGINFAGLIVVDDLEGGEHIEVSSSHWFYGYIEREILREEWRRLNHRIPQAASSRVPARL